MLSLILKVLRENDNLVNYFHLTYFQILVEFDLQDWQKREWLNVYKDHFHLLLIEENLVLAPRTLEPFSKDGILHPALVSINIKGTMYIYKQKSE